MTQKSLARQMRDEEKKNAEKALKDNRCWDELNEIYESIKLMFYQHTIISSMAGNKVLLSFLVDPKSTADSIRILGNDLKSMNGTLITIRDKHVGKSGGSVDPDEVMSSIMISQEYAMLMEQHTSVVQPNACKILEDFHMAEQRMAAAAAKAAQQENQVVPVESAEVVQSQQ